MLLSELKETSVLPKFTHLWLWKRTRDVNGNEDYEGYRNHCYGYVCDRKIWLWGLARYLKKMLFRSTRTWRKRAEVCYWLKSSWRHDIWWFPLQWHHLTLKNGSSSTLLQLNNILGREQYQFRGIFEDKKVGLLYRLIKIDSILSHPVKVSSRSPALSGQLRCKLKEHLVYI